MANEYTNNVSVIDIVNNKVIATVNVGLQPIGVAITPDGTKVCVTNSGSNSVSIIDTATNKVTATVKVGESPITLGQFIDSLSTEAPNSGSSGSNAKASLSKYKQKNHSKHHKI
jgi:YVTN family beta-propeller protein